MTLPSSSSVPSRWITFLQSVPLFTLLAERELALLSRDFVPREFAKGQIIFCQGDPGITLFVVMEGKIRIFRTSAAGDETSINIFGTGDVFGEFAAIDQQPRSATAQAVPRSTLLEMTGERFLQHMRAMPDLALGMVKLLAGKLRWTAGFAETVAQYDAAGRLLHILLQYAEQYGEAQVPGKRYVLDLSLNQADLATLVGVRREHINRLLHDWSQRGLIEYNAGKIILLDLPRVRQERDSRIEARLDRAEG
jgi:CRP/FNR family transcriptional regulator, cyclic AMP receptor protein